MKSLLSSLLILSVLAVEVNQAEAYDGSIDVNVMESDITIGDIVSYKGMLKDIEPPSEIR
jgi:hypothetical protein